MNLHSEIRTEFSNHGWTRMDADNGMMRRKGERVSGEISLSSFLSRSRSLLIRNTTMQLRAFPTKMLERDSIRSWERRHPAGVDPESDSPAGCRRFQPVVAAPPRWVHPCPSVVKILPR